ncbi:hypothetical protein MBLNU457_g2395t1 [Dothideomycetes sp. NU457]
MTTRYTDSEWATIIKVTESNVLPTITQIAKAVPPVDGPEFASTIDHTLLRIETIRSHVDSLCNEARIAGFASICVRPSFVSQACANTRGSQVRVSSVIGFPSGAEDLNVKMAEAKYCLDSGAHELDVVLNRSYLKCRPLPQYNSIYNELAALRALAPHPTILKLTLETSKLSQEDIVAACVLAGAANFDYVKTSTGYSSRGARPEDVRLMFACCEVLGEAAVGGWAGVSEENEYTQSRRDSQRNSRGSDKSGDYQFDGWRRVKKRKMQVNASGGINTLEDAVAMLQAGAARLGTSGGVWILKEAREKVEWGVRRQQRTIRDRSKSVSTSISGSRKDSKTPTAVKGHSRSKSSGQHTLQLPPSASGLSQTSTHDFATGPKSNRRSSNLTSNTDKPLPPLPPSPRPIRSAHHGSGGLIAITVSARTSNLATLHSLQKTFSNPFSGPLDTSHTTRSSDPSYRQRSQSLANASTILAATTAGKKALTTVTVAGVSDTWGRGMLGGNGIVLSKRLDVDRDRPGLATRLFSDY